MYGLAHVFSVIYIKNSFIINNIVSNNSVSSTLVLSFIIYIPLNDT